MLIGNKISNDIVDEYFRNSKRMIRLVGKKPVDEKWVNKKASVNELLSWNGNIGWALGHTDLVIDVDPKRGGFEGYEVLRKRYYPYLDYLSPTVKTPSGGFHIYLDMSKRDIHKIKLRLDGIEGVDFLSFGRQVCIVGSCTSDLVYYEWHKNNPTGCFIQDEAPDVLIDALKVVELKAETHTFDNNASPDLVRTWLGRLDPSMDYNKWLQIGQAIHSWDKTENGLHIWEEWSKDSHKYEEGLTRKKWETFSQVGGLSISSVGHFSNLAKFVSEKDTVLELASTFEAQTEEDMIGSVPVAIRNLDLGIENQVRIEKLWKTEMSRRGLPFSTKDVRKKLRPYKNAQLIKNVKWVDNWLYITDVKMFMHKKTRVMYDRENFSMVNAERLGKDIKCDAYTHVKNNSLIQIVDRLVYYPMSHEPLVTVNGVDWANCYVEYEPFGGFVCEISNDAKAYIGMVQLHIKYLFGEHAETFLDWMSHQIQNPGQLLGWCPLVQGIEGIGKSFFTRLFIDMLGHKGSGGNCGVPNIKVITGNFNDWATGVHLNILEELRLEGKNRYEVINSLKPMITDKAIQIEGKNKSAYETLNMTNYLAFTNDKDCIPISETERRWWVIYIPYATIDDFEAEVGLNHTEYFNRLERGRELYFREVLYWLSERPISEEFKNLKRSPETQYKADMVAKAEAKKDNFCEGMAECRYLIKTSRTKWYNRAIVSVKHLFDDLNTHFPGDFKYLNNRQKGNILTEMGYIHTTVTRIDGKHCRVRCKTKRVKDNPQDYLKYPYVKY